MALSDSVVGAVNGGGEYGDAVLAVEQPLDSSLGRVLGTGAGAGAMDYNNNTASNSDDEDDLETRLPSRRAAAGKLQDQPPPPVSAQLLLNHPDYIDFSSDDFDPNAYASSVVHSPTSAYYAAGGDISASLAKLAYNVEHLRKHIHDQVSTHYEDLLQQVTGLQDLEAMLASVKQGLGTLDASMDKIRAKIRTPHSHLSQLTTQLANVQMAADILRRVIRFLYLSRRLDTQMASASGEGEAKERELAKAALTYAEIGGLFAGTLI